MGLHIRDLEVKRFVFPQWKGYDLPLRKLWDFNVEWHLPTM